MAGIGVPPKAVSVAIDATPTDEVVAGESDADGPAGQPPVETAGEPAGGVTGHGRRGPLRSIGLRIVAAGRAGQRRRWSASVSCRPARPSRRAGPPSGPARWPGCPAPRSRSCTTPSLSTRRPTRCASAAARRARNCSPPRRARTDAARARFDRASRVANQTVAAVRPALADAAEALRVLPAARDLAPDSADGSAELFSLYNEIVRRAHRGRGRRAGAAARRRPGRDRPLGRAGRRAGASRRQAARPAAPGVQPAATGAAASW